MGDDLKKVQSGDPLTIPAATFNAFIDAALDQRRRQRGVGREGQPVFHQAGIILVRNDTGGDLDRFSAVGFSGPIVGPTDNEDEFKNRATAIGITPAVPSHRGRFAVYLEPVAAGGIAHACVSGVIPCRIDVAHASHRRADVIHDSTTLTSGHHGGAEILWKESGEGLKWAILKLGLSVPLGVTFDVRLVQVASASVEEGEADPDAGINGEEDCSFQYDLYDIHTNELLNKDGPLVPQITNVRPALTQMEPATRGTAYWTVQDNEIVVALEEAFERPTPRVEQYVVTSLRCGTGGSSSGSSPGETGPPGSSGSGSSGSGSGSGGCVITYQTARVLYPAGTRIEPGPEFTIQCECNCGSEGSP